MKLYNDALNTYTPSAAGVVTVYQLSQGLSVLTGETLYVGDIGTSHLPSKARVDLTSPSVGSIKLTVRATPITAAFDITTLTWNTLGALTVSTTRRWWWECQCSASASGSLTDLSLSLGQITSFFTPMFLRHDGGVSPLTIYGFLIECQVQAAATSGVANIELFSGAASALVPQIMHQLRF